MNYDTIYSVGCFDHFHLGHNILLSKMQKRCKRLIIGVHDDNSIEKLKNLKPNEHEDIYTRMDSVKRYADHVFIIPDVDPTFYLKCIVGDYENACYMRGDDMIDFPGKAFIESLMPIEYLEYTKEISSTMIRKQKTA